MTQNDPLMLISVPPLRLAYTFHPKIRTRCFSLRFFHGREQRCPSFGESKFYYATYKMTEKPETNSNSGQFRAKTPSDGGCLPGGIRRPCKAAAELAWHGSVGKWL